MELRHYDIRGKEISDRIDGLAAGFSYGFFNTVPLPGELSFLREVSNRECLRNFRGMSGAFLGVTAGLGWYSSVFISAAEIYHSFF